MDAEIAQQLAIKTQGDHRKEKAQGQRDSAVNLLGIHRAAHLAGDYAGTQTLVCLSWNCMGKTGVGFAQARHIAFQLYLQEFHPDLLFIQEPHVKSMFNTSNTKFVVPGRDYKYVGKKGQAGLFYDAAMMDADSIAIESEPWFIELMLPDRELSKMRDIKAHCQFLQLTLKNPFVVFLAVSLHAPHHGAAAWTTDFFQLVRTAHSQVFGRAVPMLIAGDFNFEARELQESPGSGGSAERIGLSIAALEPHHLQVRATSLQLIESTTAQSIPLESDLPECGHRREVEE